MASGSAFAWDSSTGVAVVIATRCLSSSSCIVFELEKIIVHIMKKSSCNKKVLVVVVVVVEVVVVAVVVEG